MKHFCNFGIAIGALLVIGSFWLYVSTASHVTDTAKLEETRKGLGRRFVDNIDASHAINVAAIEAQFADRSLLDPRNARPTTTRYSPKPLRKIYQYSRTCSTKSLRQLVIPSSLEKVRVWHEFLCGQRVALPDSFFSQAPYMHPSGYSFALLAFRSNHRQFRREWYREHLKRYFHLREIHALSEREFDFPRETVILSQNSDYLVLPMLDSRQMFASRHLLMIRRTLENHDSYHVYPLRLWDQFQLQSPWLARIDDDPNRSCLLREGGLCWVINKARLDRLQGYFAVLASLGILVIILSIRLWRKGVQRQHDEERSLILQTLTHELRTPATSLALRLEELRSRFDQLDPGGQDAYLAICDDVQRLKRVMQVSMKYLSSHGMSFHSESTNISHLAAQVASNFDINFEGDSITLDTDADWLRVCIENLVKNAINHGRRPIMLQTFLEHGRATIAIHDEGESRLEDLESYRTAFRKSADSKGLGLGLSLVETIADRLGMQLIIRSNPTVFSLQTKVRI